MERKTNFMFHYFILTATKISAQNHWRRSESLNQRELNLYLNIYTRIIQLKCGVVQLLKQILNMNR